MKYVYIDESFNKEEGKTVDVLVQEEKNNYFKPMTNIGLERVIKKLASKGKVMILDHINNRYHRVTKDNVESTLNKLW